MEMVSTIILHVAYMSSSSLVCNYCSSSSRQRVLFVQYVVHCVFHTRPYIISHTITAVFHQNNNSSLTQTLHIHKKYIHPPYEDLLPKTFVALKIKCTTDFKKLRIIAEKYAFLYKPTGSNLDKTYKSKEIVVFNVWMIHKIEIFPHYTYPLPDIKDKSQPITHIENTFEQKNDFAQQDEYNGATQCNYITSTNTTTSSTVQPYRTCSHYGFNYPLTYQPHITIHPAHLLTAVQLQREKVIAFIKSTALSLNTGYFQQQRDHNGLRQPRAPRLKSCDALSTLTLNTHPLTSKVSQDNYSSTPNIDSNGSYISVKEIKLEPVKRRRVSKLISSDHEYDSSVAGDRQAQVHDRDLHTTPQLSQEHQQLDSLSEQFSSLLSIGGTSYPAGSHSHTAELAHDHDDDHEHDSGVHHQHYDDSGDNNSSIGMRATPTTQRASYVLRDFLPSHAQALEVPEHKPESEQELAHVDTKLMSASTPKVRKLIGSCGTEEESDEAQQHAHHRSHKQLKLTLNPKTNVQTSAAVKRRCSQSSQEATANVRVDISSRDRYRHVTTSLSEADSSSPTPSLRSLEIHININVKNSDCARTLQTHEVEFRRKLERIIDEEINLIAQQLSNSTPHTSSLNIGSVHIEPSEYSQLEMATASTRHLLKHSKHSETLNDLRFAGTLAAGQEIKRSKLSMKTTSNSQLHTQVKSPPPPASACSAEANSTAADKSVSHHRLITMLEEELESLLNSIICANALHNHAVMCECKMKVAQISEELRASLNADK